MTSSNGIVCWQGYEEAFSYGLIAVIKDGKAGVINQEGEVIIPTIYDYIYITRR